MLSLIIDFAGRNWEWIAGLVGIPSVGALLGQLFKKYKVTEKMHDWYDDVNRVVGEYCDKVIDVALKAIEGFGKLLTNWFQGKGGILNSLWQNTFEEPFGLAVSLVFGIFGTVAQKLAKFVMLAPAVFVKGMRSDNQ